MHPDESLSHIASSALSHYTLHLHYRIALHTTSVVHKLICVNANLNSCKIVTTWLGDNHHRFFTLLPCFQDQCRTMKENLSTSFCTSDSPDKIWLNQMEWHQVTAAPFKWMNIQHTSSRMSCDFSCLLALPLPNSAQGYITVSTVRSCVYQQLSFKVYCIKRLKTSL